jgi:hypothetical protein
MNSKEKNILLFIIISIIFIGIGFYIFKPKNLNSNEKTKIEENIEQKTESTSIEESKEIESSKTEKETKISISQARFDEIKNYILSLDDNLLPKNLNSNEKTKIEAIRTTMKPIIQRDKKEIEDEQKKIDDYINELNKIENKKNELNKQQQTTDIKREILKCENKKKKYTNILTRAEEYKKILEERFNNIDIEFDLTQIYQITN